MVAGQAVGRLEYQPPDHQDDHEHSNNFIAQGLLGKLISANWTDISISIYWYGTTRTFFFRGIHWTFVRFILQNIDNNSSSKRAQRRLHFTK